MLAKRMVFLVASISLMTLWGCSSSMDSAGGKSEVDETYETVGIDICVQCHDIKGQEWLGSRHGNANTSPGSPHRPGESSCADCHNPLNDGDLIQFAFNTHEPRRDVVGCESCHGGGSRHYGLGPIEYSKPAPEICGECHNRDDGHHDTEKSIYDKWAGSRHAESLHGEGEYPCQRCHTNEGALASNVAAYTGDADTLGSSDDLGRRAPEAFPEEEVGPVSCATCHDVHEAGKLRTVFEWDPNENGSNNDQFDVCTSCHVLYNEDGILVGSGSTASGTAPFYHDTAWYRIIGTTHYDDPATGPASGDAEAPIEGYNIRWKNENPCFDCHGHEFRTATRPYAPGDDRDAPTIWTQWSSSAHAGHLFEVKLEAASDAAGGGDPADAPRSTDTVDAVMAAATDDETGIAWTHYNWDRTGRADCQRCHTATGASNYLDALADDEVYDPAENDYSHLDGWAANPANGSPQNEMLYCWGCHNDAADGIVRDPGPVTVEYKFEGGTQNGTFPDVTKSNLCTTCHSGRTGGMDVKAVSNADITDKSFVNSHYLAAAGILFRAIGYEYTGTYRLYENRSSFAHDKLGTVVDGVEVEPGTGTSGPCVACHLGNGSKTLDHTMVLGGFQGGTCGTSAAGVAGACHSSLTEEEIDEESESFENALYALSATLRAKGFTWTPVYPYFSNRNWTNWNGTVVSADKGRQMLGAAFNLNTLLREPGAFAHNRYYTKRLLIDSLDFAYNGVLETLTVNAVQSDRYDGSDAGDAIDAAVGLTYNDHAGVLRTFTQDQADMVYAYLDAGSDVGFQRR